MKKFLSIILAILFVFPHCNANCYKITDLPDGNKIVTIKYDDLNTIIEDILNNALNKQNTRITDITEYTKKYLRKIIKDFVTKGLIMSTDNIKEILETEKISQEMKQRFKKNFSTNFYINKKGDVYEEHYTDPVSGETTIWKLSNEEQHKLPFKIE